MHTEPPSYNTVQPHCTGPQATAQQPTGPQQSIQSAGPGQISLPLQAYPQPAYYVGSPCPLPGCIPSTAVHNTASAIWCSFVPHRPTSKVTQHYMHACTICTLYLKVLFGIFCPCSFFLHMHIVCSWKYLMCFHTWLALLHSLWQSSSNQSQFHPPLLFGHLLVITISHCLL